MIEDQPPSLIPEKSIDIIISEWMGFFLLFEGMLDSVIYAREKFLKEGGLMFPSKARLFMNAIEDEAFYRNKFHFWNNNKYGIEMSCMKQTLLSKVFTTSFPKSQILSYRVKLLDLDLYRVTPEELDFAKTYSFTIYNHSQRNVFSGVVAWFEVEFPKPIFK